MTVLLAGLAAAGAPAAPARAAGVGAQAVLANQIDSTTQNAISTVFANGRSAMAADDFVITTAGGYDYWQIDKVTVRGTVVGTPAVDKLFIRIFANQVISDAVSLPGYLLMTLVSTSYSGGPDYAINTNFILRGSPAGTVYWISVQANENNPNNFFAAWYWFASSNGDAGVRPSAWTNSATNPDNAINPDTCYDSWGQRVLVCNIPGPSTPAQLAFKLEGTSVTLNQQIYLPLIRR